MKSLSKIMSVLLVVVMLFSVTSCSKKVSKIDEDDLMEAFEKFYGWEEGEDYREVNHYNASAANLDDYNNPHLYEDVYLLFGSEFLSDDDKFGDYALVAYICFNDDDDAEEYFLTYYNSVTKVDKKTEKKYKKHKYGYFIEQDDEDYFIAYYYADDMVISATSSDKEGIKATKKLLKFLRLPC